MDVVEEGPGFLSGPANLGFLEGPVNTQAGTLVVVSVVAGQLLELDDGQVRVLAEVGGGPNGATEGADGAFYVAQNGGQFGSIIKMPAARPCRPGVQAVGRDGTVALFGLEMTAPNDICFGPDGFLYVTDPTRKHERDDGRVWRCDPATRECRMLFRCDWYPNGIGFAESDDWLYVADSRHRRIVRLPMDDLRAERTETVLTIAAGIPDGFAFDVEGRLVVACPDPDGVGTVQVYEEGRLSETIRPGDSALYTNVAISADGVLSICDASKGQVLTYPWPCAGLPLHPFRP